MMVHRVSVFLCYIPVFISAATITLDSIEIYKTHDWLPSKPTVYFLCKGENKTILPDVKEKLLLYTFKGEESWQPLTELQDKKCKRCGFYEEDIIKSDDVFDEWEFCASDFMKSDGKYIHLKDKEINATFLCPECVPFGNGKHFLFLMEHHHFKNVLMCFSKCHRRQVKHHPHPSFRPFLYLQ
ncbi:uncharacterized protein LOC111404105 isoform X2 [Olea europaea var. sylvestris]|uniref:uncharacterized protein LOC111404105 isoform X2 n=1 Tax=Olea europaea var. sylvestris TaxID=158386 RepID=UPI000C1D85DA|nr:uncharacterized protein LOC111404105 isoform X2 [Olea europaea var. sylvestris]